jgi:hypothetical protein
LTGALATLAVPWLTACTALPPRTAQEHPASASSPAAAPVIIYVIRERWHTAVGFAAEDLDPQLAALEAALPAEPYLLFGFGDRHFLMGKSPESSELFAALWPGRGVMMVNGLGSSPEAAYGATNVVRFALSGAEVQAVQRFIAASFTARDGELAAPLRPGPFPESLYYASRLPYSALYTCNTWTADVLRAGTLHVHATGVVFARQIWTQVERLVAHAPAHQVRLPRTPGACSQLSRREAVSRPSTPPHGCSIAAPHLESGSSDSTGTVV